MVLGIYGSGGAGREVKEIAVELGQWDEVIFIDDTIPADAFKGIRRMPFSSFCHEFNNNSAEVVIAVGEPMHKVNLFNKVKEAGINFGNVIHRTAWVSPSAQLGKGVILRANTVINADAIIGDNVTVQEHSSIGHDVKIGDHCQIAGHVIIGGRVEVGKETYIGLGVPIKDNCRIGRRVVVGMGSVVIRDIPDDVTAMGNPARPLRQRDENSRVF